MHRRISTTLENVTRDNQAAYRPGRSCIDHINTLRIIIEQSVEWQSPLFLIFIDFEQAFDSIHRETMWQILSSYGIPRRLLNIIMALQRETKCRIIHRGNLREWFTIQSGIKQGCVLSPLLFLLVLDWVMRKTNVQSNGIQWTITARLDDLDFAHNICLLAHAGRDMETKWNRLIHYGKQVGLNLNSKKNKDTSRIYIRKLCTVHEWQANNSFKYLGSTNAKDGGADADVQFRIQKARQSSRFLDR